MRRVLTIFATVAGIASFASTALAGGFEILSPGARALGRGGAWYARADDPDAMQYNPANLAILPRLQSSLDVNLNFMTACFDRAGTYGDYYVNNTPDKSAFGDPNQPPPNGFQNVQEPQVCDGVTTLPVFSGGVVLKPMKNLGIAIGVPAPNGVAVAQFGKDDGTVEVPSTGMRLPSPARWLLLKEHLILFTPSIAVGYAPTDWLRVGATFGWGIGILKFTNYAATFAGEDLTSESRNDLKVKDFFIPKVILSATVEPLPHFDIMAGFTWQDDIKASGDLHIVSGQYLASGTPYDDKTIHGVGFKSPQPWNLAFGLRYGFLRSDYKEPYMRPSMDVDIQDPMDTELADIEVDVVYQRTSRVKNIVIDIPDSATINSFLPQPVAIPDQVDLPHYWHDQYSVRVGGDVAIIPGNLVARAGFSYENQGVNTKYANVDFWPMQQFGLHVGLTQRVGQLDVSFGWAYLWRTPITVTPADAAYRQTVAQSGMTGSVVNQGTFTSHVQMFAAGMTTRY